MTAYVFPGVFNPSSYNYNLYPDGSFIFCHFK